MRFRRGRGVELYGLAVSPLKSHMEVKLPWFPVLWEGPSGMWLNYRGGSLLHCSHNSEWVSWDLTVLKRGDPSTSSLLSSAAMSDVPFTFHCACEAFPATWNCKSKTTLSVVNCPFSGKSLSAVWKQTMQSDMLYSRSLHMEKNQWKWKRHFLGLLKNTYRKHNPVAGHYAELRNNGTGINVKITIICRCTFVHLSSNEIK